MFVFFLDQHQEPVSHIVYVLNTCCSRRYGRQRNNRRNRNPDCRQPLSRRYTCRFYGDRIMPSRLRSLRISSNGVRTFAAGNTLVIHLERKKTTLFVFQWPKLIVHDNGKQEILIGYNYLLFAYRPMVHSHRSQNHIGLMVFVLRYAYFNNKIQY